MANDPAVKFRGLVDSSLGYEAELLARAEAEITNRAIAVYGELVAENQEEGTSHVFIFVLTDGMIHLFDVQREHDDLSIERESWDVSSVRRILTKCDYVLIRDSPEKRSSYLEVEFPSDRLIAFPLTEAHRRIGTPDEYAEKADRFATELSRLQGSED